MTPPISLSRAGVAIHLSDDQLTAMRRAWSTRQFVVFPGFLDRQLLEFVDHAARDRTFRPNLHPASGLEQKLESNPGITLLDFLMNDPALLRQVEQVTSMPRLGWFHGRIYKLTPGTDEGHDWHCDHLSDRELGVSINLSAEPFEGGLLQLRRTQTLEPVGEYANVGRGDCVVFKLSDDLEHRVLPVTGTVPRVAYAGWFYSGDSMHERFAALSAAPDGVSPSRPRK